MAKSSPHRYVDRSASGYAAVTMAGRPSVWQCLVGSASGQLPPFQQREVRYAGAPNVPLTPSVVLGAGGGIFGGLVASTYGGSPFPMMVGGLLLGLVVAVVGRRVLDAVSVRWSSPRMKRSNDALDMYQRMADKELRKKAALRDAERRAKPGLDRYDVDSLFPSRTVWAMTKSGNGVAQLATRSLDARQLRGRRAGFDGARLVFSRCREDLWQTFADVCGEDSVGVFEVGGEAHAVFGPELQGLPDADLLELSAYVVERHEVERKKEVLAAKIARARAEGADSDYPEVAGATLKVEELRDRAGRIGEAYQDRLTRAKNEAELEQLTERERGKIDRQERALRDLAEPFDDD